MFGRLTSAVLLFNGRGDRYKWTALSNTTLGVFMAALAEEPTGPFGVAADVHPASAATHELTEDLTPIMR